MRLGVSTAGHGVEGLVRLRDAGLVDFYELGIGSYDVALELIDSLGGDMVLTIHAMPFMRGGEEAFMFNPCFDPVSAAAVANRVMEEAEGLGLRYEVYGVHAGLLGRLDKPKCFRVRERISVEEGLRNLGVFKGHLKDWGRVVLENIYGWDEGSPALGKGYGELREICSVLPLLLDLGHAAVNMEVFSGESLDGLRLDGLDVREVHVSFLRVEGPPPWDHREYVDDGVNGRILKALRRVVSRFPEAPVVLEVKGGFEEMSRQLRFIRSAR